MPANPPVAAAVPLSGRRPASRGVFGHTAVLAVIASCLFAAAVASPASGQTITEFPIPTVNSLPFGITAGPDGALWFTESDIYANKIGRITTAGVISEYTIPTAISGPYGIAAGSDGALWFAEINGNKIGRITTAGVFTEFAVPTASSAPIGIAAGPDGALWFTEYFGNRIGRITTAGVITEYPIPTVNSFPYGIGAGPDGALWFTESDSSANKIGRITTEGVITEYPVPTAGSNPRGITAGPDGALWFTENVANKIGRITTAGVITEYPVPTASSYPNGIAAGPGGALWFTEYDAGANKIGRITTAGVVTEYTIPTASSGPVGIAAGPGGTLWFTEYLANQIGRITVGTFLDVPPGYWAYLYIEKIVSAGITAGCGGGNYCPDDPVTRAQMAVFLLRGEHGSSYTPPSCTPPGIFGDVPCPGGFAVDWVEQLSIEGITAGCGGGNYCPNDPVTRAQMAVFLLRAEHGPGYTPPACTPPGIFGDVTCPGGFAVDWIEQLSIEGITGGCGGGNYCPDNPNTRAQMAVFLVTAFGL